MIKHHEFFKVHLPIKDYKERSESVLAEIFMEEFYLEGRAKNYEPINPKEDELAVTLYPSILLAINESSQSENEKFQRVNKSLDMSFVDQLERFSPIYKSAGFIDYHLAYYKGNKIDFYKHIKYQILNIIKERKKLNSRNYDYSTLELVVSDWVNEKMEVKSSMEISNNENVIINQNNEVKNQSINSEAKPKESIWTKVGGVVAIITLIVTIVGLILSFYTKQ